MRYYSITVGSDQPANGNNQSSSSQLYYTSHPNGPYSPPNPGALQVDLDVYQWLGHIVGGQISSFIRIWGISVQDIGQAATFCGKPIIVQGGMGKGLPLANPAQSGVLVRGTAWQVFGNWIDTELTLDILLTVPTGGTPPTVPGLSTPIKNVVLKWSKGTQLSDAIKEALTTAYPNNTVDIKISDKLKQEYDDPHYAADWIDLSRHVHQSSIRLVNSQQYFGVGITLQGNKFIVRDSGQGSAGNTPTTKRVLFQDMIGQPTWIKLNTIQFQTVMRADLDINDEVALPPTQFTSTFAGTAGGSGADNASLAKTYADYRNASAFGGSFQIINIHHVGNSRAPDGRSWVSVFEAILKTANNAQGFSYNVADQTIPAGSA